MKIYRAIIIDDEQNGLEALSILIARYLPDLYVVAQSTKPIEAIGLIESYRPEIVFLDINMPELNGFELIENLSWRNFNLIFTTAHQEHALKALKINAFDYLLKPIDPDELKDAVARVLKKTSDDQQIGSLDFAALFRSLDQQQKTKVLVNTKLSLEPIPADEILCLESKSNYTVLYLSSGVSKVTSRSLKEYELELCIPNSNFMRVHHSYIVNLEKVMRFIKGSSEIVLHSGQKIPLANSKKEKFVQWLNV
jgi:two-component system, LytTR family, response regulator